jgi:hypothetical protein
MAEIGDHNAVIMMTCGTGGANATGDGGVRYQPPGENDG